MSGTGNHPWIFLSSKGADPHINMFAAGCGVKPTDTRDFDYDQTSGPVVLRGILKHKIIKRCWADGRDFYFVDSGYFGNQVSSRNRRGLKLWHRIVKNNLQHTEIVPRPDDRWQRLRISISSPKTGGNKIVVAAPDDKPCRFYGIDQQTWIDHTVDTIKQYTDRPIEVRQRTKSRIDRTRNDTLEQALVGAHALVTFNSNAATEAAVLGYPVFVLAPVHAALPVANTDLSLIENPTRPDRDKLYAWVCHLAYGQFHYTELQDGSARKFLYKTL
jgi:ribosomal protein L28